MVAPNIPINNYILEAEYFESLDLPPKNMILEPWIYEQSIILISGWRGVGKSWMGLSLLDCITKGVSFGPWKTVFPVNCLYIDGEMSPGDIQERLFILEKMNPSQRKARLYIYNDAYGHCLGIPKADLRSKYWRGTIQKFLKDNDIKIVVFDNISSLVIGLDENSKHDWDPINQYLIELRFDGISSILLHHVGKGGDQRGTSAREDNIDVSLFLIQPHDFVPEDGCRFVCRFRKNRIPLSCLPLINEIEFRLVEKNGTIQWDYMNLKRSNKEEILRQLDKGVPQVEIAQSLGLTKGYVSKIKNEAIREGLITSKGNLTLLGKRFLGENDIEFY